MNDFDRAVLETLLALTVLGGLAITLKVIEIVFDLGRLLRDRVRRWRGR